MPDSFLRRSRRLWIGVLLLTLVACRHGASELCGWRAVTAGVDLQREEQPGPGGHTVLGLLYTVATGQDYAIERRIPTEGLSGRPAFRVHGKATRVLHLAVVLVDQQGVQHECARTLLSDGWRELVFDDFDPPLEDWRQVTVVRLVDRTGGLGGQGPVSLKLSGLPLQDSCP